MSGAILSRSYRGTKTFLKKVLAIFSTLSNLEIVLGGTEARCSIRCDGLQLFRGVLLFEDFSPDDSHGSGCFIHPQNEAAEEIGG